MKHLILVTSPPASGKTHVSKQLAKALPHVVYLDKDTLIPLSKRIFIVANQEINRSSEFFEENIRNYEYDTIVDLAVEALEYEDLVLINAPFAREVRNDDYIKALNERIAPLGASITLIWVETRIDVIKQRMIDRDSDRDTWKIEHWEEYVKSQNYTRPNLPSLNGNMLIFQNSSEKEFNESMERIVKELLA